MLLESLEETGAEPAGEDSALIAKLEDAAMGKLEGAAQPDAPQKPENWDEDLGRELRPGEVSLADLEAAFQGADVDPANDPGEAGAGRECARAAPRCRRFRSGAGTRIAPG